MFTFGNLLDSSVDGDFVRSRCGASSREQHFIYTKSVESVWIMRNEEFENQQTQSRFTYVLCSCDDKDEHYIDIGIWHLLDKSHWF